MIKLEDVGINRLDGISHIANLAPAYVFDFENISNTVKTIITSGHRRIPVVSKGNDIIGILSYMDILNALLRGLSRNTQVSTFMTKEVIFCDAGDTLNDVLQKMKISKRGGMPVIKERKLIGMVSERDFIKLFSRKHFDIPVGNIMSHKPLFISPNMSIQTCMKTMVNTHYRRLPVVDNKNLTGIVTGLDVIHFIHDVNFNPVKMNDAIENIMTTPVKYVMEHDDVSDAVKIIVENNVGGIPVINEENHLIGIITERDIIELL